MKACRLTSDTYYGRMKRPFAYLACAIVLVVNTLPAFAELPVDPQPLCVVTSSGAHLFNVEIARSQAEKATGLMFRQALADDHGMLFIYNKPRQVAMWMKNTFIALDLVFIRQKGVVSNIVYDAQPHDLTPRPSTGRVSYVLELASGVAHKINLKAGDAVYHPALTAQEEMPDVCRN